MQECNNVWQAKKEVQSAGKCKNVHGFKSAEGCGLECSSRSQCRGKCKKWLRTGAKCSNIRRHSGWWWGWTRRMAYTACATPWWAAFQSTWACTMEQWVKEKKKQQQKKKNHPVLSTVWGHIIIFQSPAKLIQLSIIFDHTKKKSIKLMCTCGDRSGC